MDEVKIEEFKNIISILYGKIILWKLERPIPARLQKKTNELVGG